MLFINTFQASPSKSLAIEQFGMILAIVQHLEQNILWMSKKIVIALNFLFCIKNIAYGVIPVLYDVTKLCYESITEKTCMESARFSTSMFSSNQYNLRNRDSIGNLEILALINILVWQFDILDWKFVQLGMYIINQGHNAPRIFQSILYWVLLAVTFCHISINFIMRHSHNVWDLEEKLLQSTKHIFQLNIFTNFIQMLLVIVCRVMHYKVENIVLYRKKVIRLFKSPFYIFHSFFFFFFYRYYDTTIEYLRRILLNKFGIVSLIYR